MSRRRRTGLLAPVVTFVLIGLIVGAVGYRWLRMTPDGAIAIGILVGAFVAGESVRLPHLRSPIVWRTLRSRRRRRW